MTAPLLDVRGLRKHFPVRGGFLLRTRAWVRAVDDVSFRVEPGETLGIVESPAAASPPSPGSSSG